MNKSLLDYFNLTYVHWATMCVLLYLLPLLKLDVVVQQQYCSNRYNKTSVAATNV